MPISNLSQRDSTYPTDLDTSKLKLIRKIKPPIWVSLEIVILVRHPTQLSIFIPHVVRKFKGRRFSSVTPPLTKRDGRRRGSDQFHLFLVLLGVLCWAI